MKTKVKSKQMTPVNSDRVKDALLRLERAGVDIRDHAAVVDALESEIVHYQQVVQVMQDKLRQQTAKMPARNFNYDYVCCDYRDLDIVLQNINESGCRIVSVFQDENGYSTIVVEGVIDGKTAT